MSEDIGQKLIDEVRKIAAEKPAFVYTPPNMARCVNVSDGQPSCLVGHAFWNLGLIDASFEEQENNAGGVYSLTQILGLHLPEKEYNWLAQVQDNQDRGLPWGEAVKDADDRSSH